MIIFENVQNNKNFYGAVGSLNLGALCMGLALGWPRPFFASIYNRISEPIAAHLDETWMESVINVGASLGSLISIFITDAYGRRISFSLSTAIIVTFWIFLAYSGIDRILIISAAGVAGLGVGIFSATTVLYVAEISTSKNRGTVGATVILFAYFGVFIMQLFGYFFNVTIILSLMVMLPILFLVAIYFWIIESPFYLFKQGMVLDAKISLKILRDRKTILEIDEEYKSMESFFNSSNFRKPGGDLLDFMCSKSLRPMIFTVIPVLCISQMLGVTALSDYAETLIETIHPGVGNIAISFIDVISIVLCLFVIEHFGRKFLLIFTIIGSALCCLFLAIYNFTSEEECRTKKLLSDYNTFPIAILCLYYTIYAFGLIPVLPIITGEIFPSYSKTVAVGISVSLIYLICFCIQRSYVVLNKYTNSCLAFASFSMLGSIGLPFAMILLPKTKGKSLLQTQNELENIILVNY